MRGYILASKKWSLSVVSRVHNHKIEQKLGHIFCGRLNAGDKELVV
jgi:hypothetical protein